MPGMLPWQYNSVLGTTSSELHFLKKSAQDILYNKDSVDEVFVLFSGLNIDLVI